MTFGREEGNTIVVASDQASRRHARIFVSGGAHVLVDLDSTNGTFLNSKLVKEQTLRHGDVLRIASTVFKYVDRELRSRDACARPLLRRVPAVDDDRGAR